MKISSLALLALLAAGCPDGGQPPSQPMDMGKTPSDAEVSPLMLSEATLPEATTGVAYQATLKVTGTHAGKAQWLIKAGTLPPGMVLDSMVGFTVRIVGTPTSKGSYPFTVEVFDTLGEHDARDFALIVGDALAIDGTVANTTEGQPFTTTLTARGGHGQSYHWQVSSGALPMGLELAEHGASVDIAGTPRPGLASFVITVANETGETAMRSFDLRVLSVLAIDHGSVPQAIEGQSFSLPLQVSGGVPAYNWSLAGSVPPGLSLQPVGQGSTVLTGTLSTPGAYQLTIEVTDGNEGHASAGLSINVGSALRITTDHLADGQVAVPYSATLKATGGASTDYQWQVTSGTLPAGLTLATASGTAPGATLSGTPTQVGSFSFTITASTASGDSASRSFTMSIAKNPPKITTVNVLPIATWGTPYDVTISGTSPIGGAITWRIIDGALPPGLALGASSTTSVSLAGTPKLVGVYLFTVQMTDASGSAEQKLAILVDRRSGVEILAARLPEGRVGTAYAARVSTRDAVGGGVNWTVVDGALPAGVSLSGSGFNTELSGTPTTVGWYRFTLRAVDIAGNTDNLACAIRVAPARIYLANVSAIGNSNSNHWVSSVRLREVQTRAPGPETDVASDLSSIDPILATFSPLGDWLVYHPIGNTGAMSPLYLADLRGSAPDVPFKLFAGTGSLGWSDDDTNAVFGGFIPGSGSDQDLNVVDFSGPTPVSAKINVVPSLGSGIWSPDGTRLAYQSSDAKTIYVWDGASTVALSLPSNAFQLLWEGPWVADGGGLLLTTTSVGQTSKKQLYYIDAVAGAEPILLSDPTAGMQLAHIAPDASGVVLWTQSPQDQFKDEAWFVDLATRQHSHAVKLHQAPLDIGTVVWSPDSQKVLLQVGHGFDPPQVATRGPKGISQAAPINATGVVTDSWNIGWAADSAHVLGRDQSARAVELALDGTAPVVLGLHTSMMPLSVSASRRAYVFQANGPDGVALVYVTVSGTMVSTPVQLDVGDSAGLPAVSLALETIAYGAQSNAVYLVDLSGSAPKPPVQLFTPLHDQNFLTFGE